MHVIVVYARYLPTHTIFAYCVMFNLLCAESCAVLIVFYFIDYKTILTKHIQVAKRRTFSPCHRSWSRAHSQSCVGHSTFSSNLIVKKRFGFVMKRKFSAASAKAKDGGAPINVSQVRVG